MTPNPKDDDNFSIEERKLIILSYADDFWNKESAENLDKYTNQVRQQTAQEIFKEIEEQTFKILAFEIALSHHDYFKIKQKYLGENK